MRVRVVAVTFGVGFGLSFVAGVRAEVPQVSQVRHVDPDSSLAEVDTLLSPRDPHLAPEVSDPIFAYLIGLVDRGVYGAVTGDHLERVLGVTEKKSCLPVDLMRGFRRAPAGSGNVAWVRAVFTRPLDVPVPYSILGYHPGSLVASEETTFEETYFPRMAIPNPSMEGPSMIELTDLRLWALVDGEIAMDIDGWVDLLLGGKLDDTYVVGLALFWFRGNRFAMALGFNSDGEGRSGALDLKTDKIRFPSPMEIKAIGRRLRARVVRRLAEMGIPAWVPPEERARTAAGDT